MGVGAVIADLLLVDVGGRTLEFLDAVRGGDGVAGGVDPQVAIVALAAGADELDRVRCLQRGADEVIVKPFSYLELRERVAALLRRCYRGRAGCLLRAGPLTIDVAARTAAVGGRPLALSRLEFDLLRTLAGEPGRVFTRRELLRDVWGYPCSTRTRTVDSHAARLRCKLRAAGAERLLVSVWGIGYRLADARSHDADVFDVCARIAGEHASATLTELRSHRTSTQQHAPQAGASRR
ncbi:MAG: response regulator transcription factor [Solirubrobacteraceae bacterium]